MATCIHTSGKEIEENFHIKSICINYILFTGNVFFFFLFITFYLPQRRPALPKGIKQGILKLSDFDQMILPLNDIK